MKTSESVSPKHPDKMCDQISDALLDWCLTKDPNSRVAIETMGGHGHVYITGEVTIPSAEERTLADLASYAHEAVQRITGKGNQLHINIRQQSAEIAQGVDTGGAGDQGVMTGYACNDNEDYIPQEYYLARSLCKFIYDKYPYDGKTQITLNDKKEIETVVASFQNVSGQRLSDLVVAWLPNPEIVPMIYTNPAGDWNIGGFEADTGLTGRKLMVDNYGPQVAIGGGCFSGKDATKVDRSAAYMARKTAVVLLKERSAKEVFVKLAYAIGVAHPVMAIAIIDGKQETLEPIELLTPKAIIQALDLRKPQYEKTAMWGHFGNDFIWDK